MRISPILLIGLPTISNIGQVIQTPSHHCSLTILFLVKFLEAWDIMASNGAEEMTDGPEEGWLGWYSLSKQGRLEGESLASLIEQNKDSGLVWTDPKVR